MQHVQGRSGAVAVGVCLTVLAGVGWGADAPPIYDVPRMDSVRIDGKADDWGDGGLRVDLLMPVRGDLKVADDHDAAIRLGWNRAGLLLLVTVRDDVWVEYTSEDGLWRQDSIETFLAPRRGAPNNCQWVFGPGMDPRHPKPRWYHHDHRKDEALKKLPAEAVAARTKIKGGCVLEALLPWSPLAITPTVGREVAFQVWVNDVDRRDQNAPWYHAVWYPAVGTGTHTERMHRIRLAERPSPPMSVRTRGGYDIDRMETCITAYARKDQAGRTVSLLHAGKTLAERTLADHVSGRAVAEVRVPMPPPGRPFGPITVLVDGKTVDTLELRNADRQRGESFLWTRGVARPAVFSGVKLPDVQFESPLWVRALVGPYKRRVVYYDKDCNVVTKATRAGRYGAVLEITTRNGRVHRRFVTLFRQAKRVSWWRYRMEVDISLPPALGVRPKAMAAYPRTVADFVKARITDSFSENDAAAVLLAGLYESGATGKKDGFYTNPKQRDRQWWVGLKRKLYGLEKRWPKPFVCPRPIQGKPAPVVHKGTLAEAGMKPDAAKRIDAVLTAWSKDTDEAFAVCIVRHGVIVLHKAYGTRDGKPMTVTTKSWMASTTKMMSGTCMMMLVDQGVIDLDDPVGKHLPPLGGLKTNKPLTIRHLYTHTNGMEWHWGHDANDMEERIASLVPYLEVGKRYAYNGTGMELGCKILEGVSGESLPNFFRKHLLGPLGCMNTDVGSASHDAMSVPLDMARICQMLLNKGAYGKWRFMHGRTFEQMLPRKLTRVLGPDTDKVYGIGTSFFRDKGLGEGTFAHGAASSATTRIDPVHDLVISMTRNTAGRNFVKYHQKLIDAIVEGMAE